MQIDLTPDARKNLAYAAKQAGRTAEDLAADALAQAFAYVAEARKADDRDATIKALDGAAEGETVGQLRARLRAAKAAEPAEG